MLQNSKCQDCPAFKLRYSEQVNKIQSWHNMFLSEIGLVNPIKLILLGESIPANRYFYDVDSNYEYGGLMYGLKQEFGVNSNLEMIQLFRELGVIVYDCAFCPLHVLNSKAEQRHAATHCLKSYKLDFLIEQNLPVITFFPAKRGFLKRELPELSSKVCSEFKFSALHGIKQAILNNL